jgi:exodeoxyribonuclease V alpha subunit
MSEPEILEGILQGVIFKNDTGFVILRFMDKNKNPFVALGNMINPELYMDYILTGHWQENDRYGSQLKFHAYEMVVPVDANGIFKYIVRTCKFVGGKVGNAIIDKYGEDTLRMLKKNPIMVSMDIKGITIERAKEIQAVLLENEANEKVMVELEVLLNIPGMRKTLPGELIKKYKSNAAEVVKDNPYILTSFRGVNFILADRVALNIGFARDSIERKKAATIHALSENMREGNLWMYASDLIMATMSLIQVPDLKDGLDKLVEDGTIIKDGYYSAFSNPAMNELLIAEKIIKMVNFKKE